MAASGPLFHASEGIFELDFCTKSPFVIPPALPAALRFRAFWEHRDSDLIRIRRKSAFSRLGIVAGGLADLRGEREPPGCAESRQRPSLHRVTTNQNVHAPAQTAPDSKRFRKLIRNCYSRLLQVAWQPLKRSTSPCIAVNGYRWFYKPDPGLLPLDCRCCPLRLNASMWCHAVRSRFVSFESFANQDVIRSRRGWLNDSSHWISPTCANAQLRFTTPRFARGNSGGWLDAIESTEKPDCLVAALGDSVDSRRTSNYSPWSL